MTSTTSTLLRELLAIPHMSQSEIARRTGIPQPRLSKWLCGVAPRSADDALKLHALHVKLTTRAGRAARAPKVSA